MKKVKIGFCLLLLSTSFSLPAQRWSAGIGLMSDVTYSPDLQVLVINDSVFIHATRAGAAYLNKPFQESGIQLQLNYLLYEKGSFLLESTLMYHKRYSELQLRKIKNGFLTNHLLPVINASFVFQIRAGFRPFKKWKISVGLGPSFHFRSPTISGIISNNPDLKEPYEQAQSIHKRLAFNYSVAVDYLLSDRLAITIGQQASIGSVTKSFEISGTKYNYPLKWQSIGIALLYKWPLRSSHKRSRVKPEKPSGHSDRQEIWPKK